MKDFKRVTNNVVPKLLAMLSVLLLSLGSEKNVYAADVLNMDDVYAVVKSVLPLCIPFFIVIVATIVLAIVLRKKERHTKYIVKWESIIVVLAVLTITVNTICFGPMSSVLTLTFTTSDGVSEESSAFSTELTTEIAEEGTVLLKNEDSILPLASDMTTLNVFGWASTNPCYGGTGSGSVDTSTCTTPISSLEAAGYSINTELTDFYTDYCSERPEVSMWAQDWTLPEPSVDLYTDEMMENAKEFSDYALIVITRVGGEGSDLPTDLDEVTYEGNEGDFEEGETYLELSKSEEDMVELVTSNFDNVIVLINSSNSMELGWVDQYDSIKSVLWMAGPGQTGFDALGNILNGSVNPSGKLVDTYVYDLTSTPTYNNIGNYEYDNAEGFHFVNYSEGIYVGYRFYETYYLDNEEGYQSAVQYPFGYGLSYTSFEQTMSELSTDDDGNITFDVTVTNTGDVAGKDVVEVYYTAPYTNGGIEKSAVDLVKFGKTETLEPGVSQTITFTLNEEDMASYDTDGEGCYVLEAGDYDIKIMSDSHTEIDSRTYTVDSTVVYNESNPRSTDDTAATNEFDFAEGDVTYLSRADGFANYETAVAAPTDFNMSEESLAGLTNDSNYVPEEDADAQMPTTGAKNGVELADLAGLDYDDALWDDLLDELSVSEMTNLIAFGGYQTAAISSIGKVSTLDADGPAGYSSFFNDAISGTAFPCATMLAATWNVDLATARGEAMGNEANDMDISGWYGPAMNIHRSAFAGRNFEYYSEDGVLSGYMAASEVSGAASKGVYAYIKHFALNDQETNRCDMLCTWSNEQAIRQIYLKPFEIAVKEGGATAVMSSFNYIGNQWAGGCSSLLNDVLRGEWGFRGLVETDYFGGYDYMDADKAIRNGNDIMLSTTGESGATLDDTTSATAVQAMRTASHNILYTVVNSNAYYDYNGGLQLESWQKAAIGIDVVIAVVLLGLEVLVIVTYRKKKRA